MAENKLDIVNFTRIYEEFGEQAAMDTLKDVNEGRVSERTLEKYLYKEESKENFEKRIKEWFRSD